MKLNDNELMNIFGGTKDFKLGHKVFANGHSFDSGQKWGATTKHIAEDILTFRSLKHLF